MIAYHLIKPSDIVNEIATVEPGSFLSTVNAQNIPLCGIPFPTRSVTNLPGPMVASMIQTAASDYGHQVKFSGRTFFVLDTGETVYGDPTGHRMVAWTYDNEGWVAIVPTTVLPSDMSMPDSGFAPGTAV